MNTRKIGTTFEELASRYLEMKGYKILETNYRNKQGEIDLIALQISETKISSLVYVEIKYRSSNVYGDPLEAVDYRKQRRISRAASYHYAKYGATKGYGCRFDVIGIHGNGQISHVENAFDFIDW